MSDFLNIPSLKTLKVEENENDYYVLAEMVSPPTYCPHCGCVANLYGHGGKRQLFMHVPSDKRVGIFLDRKRFRCKECDKTFFEPLPDMDEKRMMTKKLVNYIEKLSLKRTFASLAEDIGINEKTIRNIFRDYVNRLEKDFRIKTPKWLGIDEIHIINKPRCVITNIQDNTIIDILSDRNKPTVIDYLQRLPNRLTVRYVAMDMWQPYRDAVRLVLPQATVVVDKFHVVSMANHALDTIRKSIREDLTPKERRTLMHDRFILLKRQSELDTREKLILESWTGNFKDLGLAYELKEAFYEIWDAQSKNLALDSLKRWREQVPEHLQFAFKDLLTALKNWEAEIFAYFDHQITNAYTESLNGLIRVMNRMGRGYSFDALRAKILFTEGVQKVRKPNYRKQEFRDMDRMDLMHNFISEVNADYGPEVNLGADIYTIIRLLEDGKF